MVCSARSVYERALDVDGRNATVWLKYAEMEMRHKHLNHARTIWDRAVLLLPMVQIFWSGFHLVVVADGDTYLGIATPTSRSPSATLQGRARSSSAG